MTNSQKIAPTVDEVKIGPMVLTSGEILEEVTLRYEISGPVGAPVILICHALTGNHLAIGNKTNPGWWSRLIGEGKHIDTNNYQVLTFNVLGGCDGSTGPATINKKTNQPYRISFPPISIRDMVHAQQLALEIMGINHLAAVIGGSLGGMQAMEWGLLYPTKMNKLIILASTPYFSDFGIAFNHIAETAIKQDPEWKNGLYESNLSLRGLEISRMIGMVTYRSSTLFNERFARKSSQQQYDISAYLDYQGKKLTERFDANSYLTLLQAMNHHDIGKGRVNWIQAAQQIETPLLAISYDKDLIFEPPLMKQFAEEVANGCYYHVKTDFGHDGFLTEFEKWGEIVCNFIANETIFTKKKQV